MKNLYKAFLRFEPRGTEDESTEFEFLGITVLLYYTSK